MENIKVAFMKSNLKKILIKIFIQKISILMLYAFVNAETLIDLPKPSLSSQVSLEETLKNRRSVREFSKEPLTLKEVSQILWAAQGITDANKKRTAPSAGALYPIRVYLLSGNVKRLPAGIYLYEPATHQLVKNREGDMMNALSDAALGQPWIKNAATVVVLTGVYEITKKKYGERGIKYVHIETGHIAQNILLQVVALDLGAVPVGAFNDNEVRKVLNLSEKEFPLYIIPIGRKIK